MRWKHTHLVSLSPHINDADPSQANNREATPYSKENHDISF